MKHITSDTEENPYIIMDFFRKEKTKQQQIGTNILKLTKNIYKKARVHIATLKPAMIMN